MDTNYLSENALQNLSANLHQRYIQCVAIADTLLVRYRSHFPEYTDHTLLHSVEVTNISNYLISNRISQLSAGELYILLMSALLHDVGMGLSEKEVEKYGATLDYDGYRVAHPEAGKQDFIRDFHHDLSAMFIMDNWRDCMIPDEAVAAAIAEVGRGHRKTDLMDRTRYPSCLQFPAFGPDTVNMPYLAAVIRLADEMDVSASRNLMLQYSGFIPKDSKSVMEFQKHRSVRSSFLNDRFVISAETDDHKEYAELVRLHGKVEETLSYCQKVVESCTGMALPVRIVENGIRFTGDDAPLALEMSREESILTVALSGKLDTITSPMLEEKLANNLGGAVKSLILDFSSLVYVSSAGLRVILSANKKMLQLQGDMSILNVSPEIMDIFRMTGFDSILQIESGRK